MKRVVFIVTLCCALYIGSLTTLSAQTPPATSLTYTYSYSGYPVSIPTDSANIAVLLKITFPRAMTIQKVTASVQVSYPDVGDLNVYMFSPIGTRVKLLERNCGGLLNIDSSFDDGAQTKYADFCPAEAGRGPYQGNEPLSNFIGQEALGTWTLAVENNGSDSRSGSVVGFSVTISGTSKATAALGPDGIRNSASPLLQDLPIAPGEFISVFGYNLGPQQGYTSDQEYWPTYIDGTAIKINDVDAPMRFISFYRIDVQVPTGLDLSQNAKVTVFRGGVSTNAVEVPVASTSPAIFTTNLVGVGQANAVNSDGTANSTDNPAARGSVVTVYASGLGLTNPLAPEGQPVTIDCVPIATIYAWVGGVPTQMKKAVLTQGKTAVYSVDILVPTTINAGTAEVFISAGDRVSQRGVTIQVK